MSKKKNSKKKELAWTDDAAENAETAPPAAAPNTSVLQGVAEAMAKLQEFEDVVVEEVEVAEVDSAIETPEEGDPSLEFSEEELAALGVVVEDEPTAIILDEDESPSAQLDFSAEGTELENFDSAQIEVTEEVPEDRIASIVESLLFSTDRPQSVAVLKAAFKGTNVRSNQIRRALDQLQIEYAGARRGIYLEEISGGYQLRTKVDNMEYLRRTVKARPFRVSGPALEVLAIVAYKQPVVKNQIDEIRGVESGHLLRALMEKGLVHFAGKSELPGKPMYYGTSRRFLETFGLRNLNELPSLAEIDQLIPEGIGDEPEKETLDQLTGQLSKEAASTYSEGEEELMKIAGELEKVTTTTEFFEQEKARMKAERDHERARDLRDAVMVGESIADNDRRWLERFEREQAVKAAATQAEEAAALAAVAGAEPGAAVSEADVVQLETISIGQIEAESGQLEEAGIQADVEADLSATPHRDANSDTEKPPLDPEAGA